MLNQQIIHALAASLNSRYSQTRNAALSALSKLVVRRSHGNPFVTSHELSALLHTPVERGFPFPYIQVHINAVEKTVTVNNFVFSVPEEEPALHLEWGHSSHWRVAVLNEQGKYELVASSDPYAIPHGQVSVELEANYGPSARGASVTANMVLVNGTVTWLVNDIQQAARILANDGLGAEIPFEFQRTYNQIQRTDNMILESTDDLSTTFIDGDALVDLGLEYPETGMTSVRDLIDQVLAVKAANPEPAKEDEETLKVALKIQAALNFQAMLTDVMALPAKKRTAKAINDVIVKYLPQQ